MESHWLLLKPLEHWGCRVNCHPEVWKDWQVQRVIAKMWLWAAEDSGALNGGNTHLSGRFDTRWWLSGDYLEREKLCWGKMPPHPSFYVRLGCYDKCGLYSLDYPICADYDMFVKMIWEANIKTLYINDVFVNMRSGGTSSSGIRVHRKIMKERMRCVREHNLPSNFFKQTSRYFEKVFSLLKK